jgi:hypothetical protein
MEKDPQELNLPAATELKVTPDLFRRLVQAQRKLNFTTHLSRRRRRASDIHGCRYREKTATPGNVAKDKIVVKGVTVQGVFEVTAMGSRGVEEIKELFQGVKELGEESESTVNLYTLGSHKYRVEVTAEYYKKAELAFDRVVKHAEKEWAKQEGTFLKRSNRVGLASRNEKVVHIATGTPAQVRWARKITSPAKFSMDDKYRRYRLNETDVKTGRTRKLATFG